MDIAEGVRQFCNLKALTVRESWWSRGVMDQLIAGALPPYIPWNQSGKDKNQLRRAEHVTSVTALSGTVSPHLGLRVGLPDLLTNRPLASGKAGLLQVFACPCLPLVVSREPVAQADVIKTLKLDPSHVASRVPRQSYNMPDEQTLVGSLSVVVVV